MVATAVYLNSMITPTSSDGKRYFVMGFQATAFNDTSIRIIGAKNNPVFSSAQQIVYFEGIQFLFSAAAAGIKGNAILNTSAATTTMAYYGPFATTTTSDAITWRPNIAFPKLQFADNDANSWFQLFNLTGYGAADGCTLIFYGWIDSMELEPSPAQPVRFERPQTVSVEGVKLWSRR